MTGRAPIVLAEVRQVALPLLKPFVTGFGVTDTRQTVVVHLRDEDGNEGWGEMLLWLPETSTPAMRASMSRGSRVSAITERRTRSARRDGCLTGASLDVQPTNLHHPQQHYETQTYS